MSNDNTRDPSGQTGLSVNLPGGALRIQYGKSEDFSDQRFENEAVRSGVDDGSSYRTTPEGGIEQFGQVTRHNVMEDFDANSDDILATARNPWGSPATTLNDKSIVRINGTDVPIKAAIALGWIARDGRDGYRVTGAHRKAPGGVGAGNLTVK